MNSQPATSGDPAAASVIPTPLKDAFHIAADSELPYFDLGDGSALQLLQVDIASGLWIVRVRFEPGCKIDKHYHTGSVFAVTLEGSWYYEEYPETVNSAGSYLFEPAGSVHTLTVPADATEPAVVWFAVHGANVNVAEDGSVISVIDASTVLQVYRAMASEQNLEIDDVLVIGE